MDINKTIEALESHEAVRQKLESIINNDMKNDQVLRNSLINKRDFLERQINQLEEKDREHSLLEKQLFEKEKLRDLSNLHREIDKRSSYTKFK